MPRLIENFRYRREIDGLRAIAVLSVLFFHVKLGFPGGFIGVDVFFVISGFLITSLIMKDLQEGTFTLFNFWERRARRIMPALAVMTIFTLIAGAFLLLPIQFADLGKSGLFLASLIANVYFYLGTGYFAGATEEKPLLHTWSLAVEEQFYFVVPLLLWGLFRFSALRHRAALLSVLCCGLAVSLWLSITWVTSHPAAAFFLLPTRAWELLLGSVLALLPPVVIPAKRSVREIGSCLGLAGILIPCFTYSQDTPFPGWASVPPCFGAALLIWSSGPSASIDKYPKSTIQQLLSAQPFVFIGLISYSLYLWHWPLVAFANYWALEPTPVSWRWAIVLVSLILGILSWHFIETPFRTRKVCATRPKVFAASAFGLAAIAILGACITVGNGWSERMPSKLRHAFAENPQDDLMFVRNLEAIDIKTGDLVPFGISDKERPVDILVWGDSHAMAALPAFDLLCKERGWRGQAATYSSRAPLLGFAAADSSSQRFSEAVLEYVRKKNIPRVVLCACWHGYAKIPRDAPAESTHIVSPEVECLKSAMKITIREVLAAGAKPYIMLMVPSAPYDVPKAMLAAEVLGRAEADYAFRPSDFNGLAGYGEGYLAELEKLKAIVLDPRPTFFDPTRTWYMISHNGHALYRDRHHLTLFGAENILKPLLSQKISDIDDARMSPQQ
jgi:peptidoglycan/LPS O-acetylase OafA/YrhL